MRISDWSSDVCSSDLSDVPDGVGAYRLETLADDIIALLDALDVREPAHLVGHDWGAVVGWKLAIDHAARFKSFVVMSVGHPAEYRRGFEQKWRDRKSTRMNSSH